MNHGLLAAALVILAVVFCAVEEQRRIVARVEAAERARVVRVRAWRARAVEPERMSTACPTVFDSCDSINTIQRDACAADEMGEPGPWCCP